MALLASLLLGVSVMLVFIGMGLPKRDDPVQTRLRAYGTRPRSLTELELSMPFTDRVVSPAIRGMSLFITRFAPQRNIEQVRHRLDLAGNPHQWAPVDFLGVRGLAAIVAGTVTFAPMVIMGFPLVQLIIIPAGAALLGFYLPILWLGHLIRTRQHDVLRALPDALDLLTISVEAGLGFDAAMARVADKSDNELSRAFARVNAEIRVGKLRRDALRDMATRVEVPDVTNFIAAIIQADQLGVSIAKVLRIQSEQMRIKRRQRAEELAAQAPVKMMFPLVFLIFPSILIVLLGPAVLIFMKGGLGG